MSGGRFGRDAPYRVLLGEPAIRWQGLSGLLAQVTQGASGVGIILVIREHTGSLPLAGGVVGALSVAAGIARPLQGRLMDRRGTAGVMAGTGVVHAIALAAIVWLTSLSAPGAVLVMLGLAAGASLPPVSTAMRVDWGQRVANEERTAAYSLVYLVQELAILIGPLTLAAIIAVADASAAVVVIAAITALGAIWFASYERPHVAQRSTRPVSGGLALRSGSVRALVLIAVLVGGVVGAVEVAVPIIATAHRNPAASGLLIGTLAVGGILGAVTYAVARLRSGPALRLVALLLWVTAAIALAGITSSLLAVGALLLLCGLALNPALTTISLLVDLHTPGQTAAEAFGWLSTGIAGGTGAASAIAGAITRHGGSARPAFLLAAAAAAAATLTAAAARRSASW